LTGVNPHESRPQQVRLTTDGYPSSVRRVAAWRSTVSFDRHATYVVWPGRLPRPRGAPAWLPPTVTWCSMTCLGRGWKGGLGRGRGWALRSRYGRRPGGSNHGAPPTNKLEVAIVVLAALSPQDLEQQAADPPPVGGANDLVVIPRHENVDRVRIAGEDLV